MLTHSAVQNRTDLVEPLLDHGADVHRYGVPGPLDTAERPVADLRVAHGYDVNINPLYGAMLVRACRGDVSGNAAARVEVLLEPDPDVNRAHYGLTALHYAVRAGPTAIVKLLLEYGADIHCRDRDSLTPLDRLARTRARADPIPVLGVLLKHGAGLNSRNPHGETILFCFARCKDVPTV